MRKPILHHLHDYFLPHERNNHRPHLFSTTSVAVLALAVIILEAGFLVQTKFVYFKTDFLASVLPGALVALTNQDRLIAGLSGVTEDPLLNAAAQAAAEDMAVKGYFAHNSPDGKTPWYWLNQVGYTYSYAGQNLAVNFTDSQNVETAWLESPTHRANIMKPEYTRVGFGTANGIYEGQETTFVVEYFAALPEAAPVNVALAEPAAVELSPAPSVKELGSDTNVPPTAPAAKQGWFVSLLASPLNTLLTILTILLVAVGIPFAATIFIRGKAQHPNVLIGGAVLFVVISIAIFLAAMLTSPVIIAAGV